jgi:hypothetical protein
MSNAARSAFTVATVTPLGGESVGFGQSDSGGVHRRHLIAETGKKDRVAALAFGEAQHPAARDPIRDGGEKCVGLGAVGVAGFGESFIPHEASVLRAENV